MAWGVPSFHEPKFISHIKHDVQNITKTIDKNTSNEVLEKKALKAYNFVDKTEHSLLIDPVNHAILKGFEKTDKVVKDEFRKLPRKVKRDIHHAQNRIHHGLKRGTQLRETVNQEIHNVAVDAQAKFNLVHEEVDKIKKYMENNINNAISNIPDFPDLPDAPPLFDIDPKWLLGGIAGVGALFLI